MFLVLMAVAELSAGELAEAKGEELEAALARVGADKEMAEHISVLVEEQLREAPVLGLSDGLWLMPVDLGALTEDREVVAALEQELAQDGLALPADLELGYGMAFVPGDIAREMGALDDLGQYAELGEEMLEQKATDIVWFAVAALAVGTVYVGYEIYEAAYGEGYNDGVRQASETYSDTKDSDGDGKLNHEDPDDDNDGVNDKDDQYPFDNKRDICDLCGGGSIPGFADVGDTFFFTDGLESELVTELAVDAITNFVESQGAVGLALSM